MKYYIPLLLILFFLPATVHAILPTKETKEIILASSTSNQEDLALLSGKEIQITAKLRLVGGGRRRSLVVTTDSNIDLYLLYGTNENTQGWMDLQGKVVRVVGVLGHRDFIYQNPKYNHRRWYLTVKRLSRQ